MDHPFPALHAGKPSCFWWSGANPSSFPIFKAHWMWKRVKKGLKLCFCVLLIRESYQVSFGAGRNCAQARYFPEDSYESPATHLTSLSWTYPIRFEMLEEDRNINRQLISKWNVHETTPADGTENWLLPLLFFGVLFESFAYSSHFIFFSERISLIPFTKVFILTWVKFSLISPLRSGRSVNRERV